MCRTQVITASIFGDVATGQTGASRDVQIEAAGQMIRRLVDRERLLIMERIHARQLMMEEGLRAAENDNGEGSGRDGC